MRPQKIGIATAVSLPEEARKSGVSSHALFEPILAPRNPNTFNLALRIARESVDMELSCIDISEHKDELSRLFKNGFTYDQLVDHLSKTYHIPISKTTIKVRFREWKVKKRNKRVYDYQQEREGGLVKIAEQEWMSDQEHHDTKMVPLSSCPLLLQDELVNPDIFALLRPENENARFCIRMPANQTRYVGFDNMEAEIGSRDPTPAPGVLPCIDLDHLVLRFSDTETNQWTIGRDESCEIVFQGSRVSRRHCCIFAEDDGIYIKDISTYGTSVAYNSENPVLQKSGKWLIARKPGELTGWETLKLQVGNVAMSIVLPYHNSSDPTYLENFQTFTQAGESALPAMTRLGLVSHSSTIALGTPNYMQTDIFGQDPSSFAPSTDSESVNQEARDVAIVDLMGQYSDLNAGMVRAGRSDAPSLALEGAVPFISSDITHLQTVQEIDLSGENGWDYQLPKRTDVANFKSNGREHLQLQTIGGRSDGEQHKSWVQWQNQVLRENDELDTIEMVLENHIVSMRTSDCFLSAAEIMRFAQINKEKRARIHRLMKENAPGRQIEKSTSQTWVSFTDGYFLCEYLGLGGTLSPLLEYGRSNMKLQRDRGNYLLDKRHRKKKIATRSHSVSYTEDELQIGKFFEVGIDENTSK